MQYQWAIRVTTEYLDSNGKVFEAVTKIQEAHTEKEARARQDALIDTIASRKAGRTGGPKCVQTAASELVRRPIGDWETVSKE
jgi:hypothetical protein